MDWRVSILPVASNVLEQSVLTLPGAWLLVGLLESLKIFLPHSNLGVVMSLGFGIKNEPLTYPILSVFKLIWLTVAWALDVWPTNLRSFSTYPKKVFSDLSAKLKVSILISVLVVEYSAGTLSRLVSVASMLSSSAL